jgi:hypothetical protein
MLCLGGDPRDDNVWEVFKEFPGNFGCYRYMSNDRMAKIRDDSKQRKSNRRQYN